MTGVLKVKAMLNVLINAYSIAPNWGSEQGVGWNWTIQIAKYCNCFVITESEFRKEIEEAVSNHPYKQKLHFFYIPVTQEVRDMCWNQGDYRFYFYYKKWQERALEIAKTIIKSNHIDIIHQLNMVCFREPGFLWKIDNIPFVWGPISGFNPEYLPFMKEMGMRAYSKIVMKDMINKAQVRWMPRVRKAFYRSDAIITTTPYCRDFIKSFYSKDATVINETGIHNRCVELSELKRENDGFLNLLWVGRFIKTKKLDIALKTIANLKHLNKLKLHIVGYGVNNEECYYKALSSKLGIDNCCIWYGKKTNTEVQAMMRKMDVFFFTSIAEATSTVVPEAIQNRLPIICHDACAFGPLVTSKIGWKIKPITPQKSISDFSLIIEQIYDNQGELCKMWGNFDEVADLLNYENKGRAVFEIYNKILSNACR